MFEYLLYNSNNSYTFPKYDLYIDSNKAINLDVALAGYNKNDLVVYYENQELIIKTINDYKSEEVNNRDYITKGLAKRKFKLKFNLLKAYKISECKFKDGLLKITLTLPKELEEKYQIHIE